MVQCLKRRNWKARNKVWESKTLDHARVASADLGHPGGTVQYDQQIRLVKLCTCMR
jgi:hypothetical protein